MGFLKQPVVATGRAAVVSSDVIWMPARQKMLNPELLMEGTCVLLNLIAALKTLLSQ